MVVGYVAMPEILAFFARVGCDATDTTFLLRHNLVAYAFVVPALRKVREGRGTRCVGDAKQIKSLGHPPLAYVLTMGDVSRFPRGKQVASYLGLIPRELSSGGRQKLGAISKQGNRMLLVEAAQTAVRLDPGLRKEYLHRCHQKPKAVAKVAAARKLAVRLYWMLRTQKPYPEVVRIERSPRVPLVGAS